MSVSTGMGDEKCIERSLYDESKDLIFGVLHELLMYHVTPCLNLNYTWRLRVINSLTL